MAHKVVVWEWLYKADQDYGFARTSFDDTVGYFNHICFHCHQAVEKYLKAYIIKNELLFKKIHDLIVLLSICSSKDSRFNSLEEYCQYLTPFYFETRYADDVFFSATKANAKKSLVYAKLVQDFVREKLGIEKEITLDQIKKLHKKVDDVMGK